SADLAFVIVGGRSDLRPVVDVQPLVVRLPEHVLLQRWGGRVPADLELGDRAAVTRWGIDGPEQLVGSLGVARGHPVDVGDDRSLALRRGGGVGRLERGGVVDGGADAGGGATGARSEGREWRSTAGGHQGSGGESLGHGLLLESVSERVGRAVRAGGWSVTIPLDGTSDDVL